MNEQIVTRVIEGVTLGARWSVDANNTLTVRGPCGTKSTQLGGSSPTGLAMIMLREMFEDRCC
jgi:hypothetical protein